MSGEKNLDKLIASMSPELLEDKYIFHSVADIDWASIAKLIPKGVFQEKEGMTLIISEQRAIDSGIHYDLLYRCITLNVHSSLEAVGLTAAFSNVLTKHNISANVVAGYYHDHIFVADKDAQRALTALTSLSLATAADTKL